MHRIKQICAEAHWVEFCYRLPEDLYLFCFSQSEFFFFFFLITQFLLFISISFFSPTGSVNPGLVVSVTHTKVRLSATPRLFLPSINSFCLQDWPFSPVNRSCLQDWSCCCSLASTIYSSSLYWPLWEHPTATAAQGMSVCVSVCVGVSVCVSVCVEGCGGDAQKMKW